MRTLKKWYTVKRNGVIYVQFKDKITGKKLTARSTGTRDEKEADEIINKWYYDPNSFYNTGEKEKAKTALEKIIESSLLSGEEVNSVFAKVVKEFYEKGMKLQSSFTENEKLNSNSLSSSKKKILNTEKFRNF